MTMPVIDLALLEQPCPDCPTEADLAAMAAEFTAWRAKDDAAEAAYKEAYVARRGDDRFWWESWTSSPEFRAVQAEMPPDLPDRGCFECDFTGTVPTEQGRLLLDFVRRYTKA